MWKHLYPVHMVHENGSGYNTGLERRVNPVVYKNGRSYYTEERIANARRNMELYPWAKETSQKAIKRAEFFLACDHEWLWSLVTTQKLPRSYGVNQTMGCPVCKKEIDRFGNYPYLADPLQNPWKLTCPSCKTVFPSNDFGAYYQSAIDAHGRFDPELGDRSLLKNTLYPDKGDDWCVDDGYGWLDPDQEDPETRRYTFIAYYNHWYLWHSGMIEEALHAFCDAYLYTGDSRFAAAGTILLDRIADVYPEMDSSIFEWKDGFRNSHGLTGLGKVIGNIWETGLIKSFIQAYDALFPGMDDPQITAFLSQKAKQYGMDNLKNSGDAIRHNIEQGIILPVKSNLESGQVRGNVGMHQSALALAAVVLNRPEMTKEWVEYIFATRNIPHSGNGNILKILVDEVDRNGHGDEASPSYNSIWLEHVKLVADALSGYRGNDSYDLYRHPKFRKLFHMLPPLVVLGAYTPSIGDTKKAGDPGIIGSLHTYVTGFAQTGDLLLAQFAHFLNGYRVEGIHGDIFSDNENMLRDIEQVIETHGRFDPGSTNITGYGYTVLREGKEQASRALVLYYGRNTGHGHRDTLNLGIYAFGLDLAPDHGYPCFADGNFERKKWTINTVSHNTVMVDRSAQASQVVGIPHHYEGAGKVKLIDAEAPKVYPETRLYRRTAAMIAIDETDSYIVDLFRVKGGTEHLYSFHGGEGEVTVEGLRLEKQQAGTYAGEQIPFADRNFDQESESGFNYLYNVERDGSPQGNFSLDWRIKDTWKVNAEEQDVHLRLTMLTGLSDVALADGEPPQNKPGNPKSYRYMLARRTGDDLESQFVSVVEAYRNNRKVQSVSAVPVQADSQPVSSPDVFAVKITLQDGRTDYIINALNTGISYTVDNLIRFQGFMGVCSLRSGQPVYGYVCDGTLLAVGDRVLVSQANGSLTGKVVGFTKEMSSDNRITAALDGVGGHPDLTGKFVNISNDGVRNASYEIKGAAAGNDGSVILDIGDITPIRSWTDASDFSRGYVYDFAEGNELLIPLSFEWNQ